MQGRRWVWSLSPSSTQGLQSRRGPKGRHVGRDALKEKGDLQGGEANQGRGRGGEAAARLL